MRRSLGTPGRLALYAGVLAIAFAAAFVVGSTTEPLLTDADTTPTAAGSGQHQEASMTDDMGSAPAGAGAPSSEAASAEGHGGHGADAGAALAGLAVSERGYTLVPASTVLPAGSAVPFSFVVLGPDGHAVEHFVPTHEKELHLIVVRRDLSGFQHVHPSRDASGTWSVPLDLTQAGTYRVFADFAPAGLDGETLTLGTDVAVAGTYAPATLPLPAATSSVAGYQVRLDGTPVPGEETDLTFTVSRDGQEVGDLEAYLGAFGHLVSLRAGDLAYLHNHPAQDAHAGELGGPAIRFATTFPTAGSYRLFLDFQHEGRVRTAEFTIDVQDESSHGH